MSGCCPNLTVLTPLFKGSDVPTKVGRTFPGTREQFATNDSYGYQLELLGASQQALTTEPRLKNFIKIRSQFFEQS